MSNSRLTFPGARMEKAISGSLQSEEQIPFISPSNLSLHEADYVREAPSWFSRSKSLLASGVARTRTVIYDNAGLLLVAASQGFFAMMNVSVKKLNSLDPPVSTLQLVIVRMAITYICCMIYVLVMKVPDPFLGPKGIRLLLAFRGFAGFFGLSGVYYSLQYLSLSDATVLTFLAPFGTAIAGSLILKETFTKKEAFAGLSMLFGVVLIARPAALFGGNTMTNVEDVMDGMVQHSPDDVTSQQRLAAVGAGLVGVLGSVGAFTSLRAIGKRAHALHSLTSFSLQCVIVASIGMAIMRMPVVLPTGIEWLFLFMLIGIFGVIGQVLVTLGLQRETAGRGSMAIYVHIVYAMIFERIFFHTTPSFLSIFGTIIIMSSAIYIVLTKTDKKQTGVTLEHPGEATLEEGLLQHTEHSHEGGEEMHKLKHVQISDSLDNDSTLNEGAKET